MKYFNSIRKSEQPVKAIQYNLTNLNEVIDFVGSNKVRWCCGSEELWIETSIGEVLVRKGSYVIKKQEGNTYPLAKNLFQRLYQLKKNVEIHIESVETM